MMCRNPVVVVGLMYSLGKKREGRNKKKFFLCVLGLLCICVVFFNKK